MINSRWPSGGDMNISSGTVEWTVATGNSRN